MLLNIRSILNPIIFIFSLPTLYKKNQMLSFLQHKGNKKQVIFGLATLAIFALEYYLTRKQQKKDPPKEKSKSAQTQILQKDIQREYDSGQKLFAAIIERVKNVLKGKRDGLSFEEIQAIYKGLFQLSNRQFLSLAQVNREERRKCLWDKRRYHKFVVEFQQGLDQIHDKHLDSLLTTLGIDRRLWNDQINFISIAQEQQWEELLLETEKQQAQSLRNITQPLHNHALLNAFNIHLRHLKTSIPAFQQALQTSSTSDLYSTVERWCFDKVFEQSGVEREDIDYAMQKNQMNLSERQELYKVEGSINSLMDDLMRGNSNRKRSKSRISSHNNQASLDSQSNVKIERMEASKA